MLTIDDLKIINAALSKGKEIVVKSTKDGVAIYTVDYTKAKAIKKQ